VFSRGDCEGAKKLAEPHAIQGEPWAQFKMGMLLMDEKCPQPPREQAATVVRTAMDWLMKAACYESKSAWERGNELAVGKTGYFNARASSTNAALAIADFFEYTRQFGAAWVWVKRATQLYDANEPDQARLLGRLGALESKLTPGQLSNLSSYTDPCKDGKLRYSEGGATQ